MPSKRPSFPVRDPISLVVPISTNEITWIPCPVTGMPCRPRITPACSDKMELRRFTLSRLSMRIIAVPILFSIRHSLGIRLH